MDTTSARSLSLFPTAATLVNATEERTKFQSFARKKATEAGFTMLASIFKEFGLGSSPSVFLHAMKLTSTIISGSIALAVLHPGMFRHGDMDLYTTSTPRSHLLCDILLSFGYTALETVSLPGSESIYSTKSIGCVRRYQMRSGSQHHFINVFHVNSIDQCHPTPISAVFEFVSTLAMNYISYYGIVCLYPRTTLARHGYWLYESADAQDWIDKYVERGFDLEAYNETAGTGERYLYDNGVLFLPFEKDCKPKLYSVQLVEHNFRWSLL